MAASSCPLWSRRSAASNARLGRAAPAISQTVAAMRISARELHADAAVPTPPEVQSALGAAVRRVSGRVVAGDGPLRAPAPQPAGAVMPGDRRLAYGW